jgi:WD40 repeat protein
MMHVLLSLIKSFLRYTEEQRRRTNKEENTMKLVETFGTPSSARYVTSYIPIHDDDDEHLVDIPIGPCIARWDMKHRRRIMLKPIHQSVITFVRHSPMNRNLIVSCSYDGEVRCWDNNWNPLSDTMHVPCEKLTHACWSLDGTKVVVTCQGSAHGSSLVSVITVTPSTTNQQYSLNITSKISGCFESADFIGSDDQYIFVTCEVKTDISKGVTFQLYEKNVSHQSTDYNLIKSHMLNERGPLVTVVEPNEARTHIAIALQDRRVCVVNMKTLDIELEFQCPGASSIRCILFEDDLIYTKSQARALDMWKIDYSNKTAQIVQSYKTNFSTVYMFCWMKPTVKNALYVVTDNMLHKYDLETQRDDSISFHSLTCCGIDFSPDGNYVISGDFAGNVCLWPLQQPHNSECFNVHEVYQQTNVMMSVRAIKCKWSLEDDGEHTKLDVYIGTLDGNVWKWFVNLVDPSASSPTPEILFTLQDSITCIELQHGPDPKLLAVGTSDGMLCVMERPRPGEGSLMRIRLAIVAHRPITDNTDYRFGSINKFSEVWSISWSPCNNFIVTASEDQTCSIWNLYGEKMHSLTGHTTAVTAVEWRTLPSLGEILITCADDRKVMVWRLNTPKNMQHTTHHHQQLVSAHRVSDEPDEAKYLDRKNKWGLYCIFTTDEFGLDWHTLTYMCVERKQGDRIAVATQNGYVFVWDILTKQLISRMKRHNGSIEGMAWSDCNRYLGTCSSDCTVNLYYMH